MKIKQHPGTGLWIRVDGAVLMPPDGYRFFKFRWTYGYDNGRGYLRVKYHGKKYQVHRLVAETYIPNPNGYKEVDHINRVKTANFVSNLRWCNRKMQCSNMQKVDEALARYGVRSCENSAMYMRAYRAKNNEFAERERAKDRARKREYYAKQKALGKRVRKCPDGVRRFLTDEEFDRLYKEDSHGR